MADMNESLTVILDEDGRYLGTIDRDGKMVDTQVLSTRIDEDSSYGDMGDRDLVYGTYKGDDYDEEEFSDEVATSPDQKRKREAELLDQLLNMDARSHYTKKDFSFIKSSALSESGGLDNLFDPDMVHARDADSGYFSDGRASTTDEYGDDDDDDDDDMADGYYSDGDEGRYRGYGSQLNLKKLNPFRKLLKKNGKSKGGSGLMGTAVLSHRGRIYVARESGEQMWNLPTFQFEPWSDQEIVYADMSQRNLNELLLERFNRAIVMTGLSRTAPDYKYEHTTAVMMGDNHAVLVATLEDALDSKEAAPYDPATSPYDELVAVSWEQIRGTIPRLSFKKMKLKFYPQVGSVLRALKSKGYATKKGISVPLEEAIVPDGRHLRAQGFRMRNSSAAAAAAAAAADDDEEAWTLSADHLPFFTFFSMSSWSHLHLAPQMPAFAGLFSEVDSGRMRGLGRGGRRGVGGNHRMFRRRRRRLGRGRGGGGRRGRGLFGGPWRYGRGRFWRRGLRPWIPFVPLRYLALRNALYPRTYARINDQMPRAQSLPSLPSFSADVSGEQLEMRLNELRSRYGGIRNMGYDIVPNFTNRRFEWARVASADTMMTTTTTTSSRPF